jgi:hypothetical protein
MLCLACEKLHSLNERMEREEPVALVLCDQNFPPILPTIDGRCISVIRIEDGRLFELEKTFAEILPGILKPHGRLPAGSVVMVGSLSHLGSHGLESYTGDLVKIMASMAAALGGGVAVIPYVPIPLGGVASAATIRALYDLDSWILAGNEKTLAGTRKKFWEIVGAGGGGGPSCDCERVYSLPASAHNPRKRPFWSRAVNPSLPKKLEPISTSEEKILLQSIINELTANFGISLHPDPALERGVETPAHPLGSNRTYVIGASHMTRTAEHMPLSTISLAFPGFRPDRVGVEKLSASLSGGNPGENDVVVMDLLSNLAFMGTDMDGLPTPAIKSGDGRYHILGSLTTAPPTVLKKTLELCVPLANAAKGAKVVLVCPIPRYVKTKCCDDPSHITNFGNEDYEDELMDFQDQHRKILVGWGSSQGLDYEIFDPSTVVNPTEPGLGNRLTTSGTSLWADKDGVHLSAEGYRDVAMGLADIGRGDGEQALSDASSSVTSESSKRKRPDCIITVPDQKKTRSSAATPPMPEWVTGRQVTTEWSNRQQNPRGFTPGGSWIHRGGGWGTTWRGNRGGWRGGKGKKVYRRK